MIGCFESESASVIAALLLGVGVVVVGGRQFGVANAANDCNRAMKSCAASIAATSAGSAEVDVNCTGISFASRRNINASSSRIHDAFIPVRQPRNAPAAGEVALAVTVADAVSFEKAEASKDVSVAESDNEFRARNRFANSKLKSFCCSFETDSARVFSIHIRHR
jgi:hypothetical protein